MTKRKVDKKMNFRRETKRISSLENYCEIDNEPDNPFDFDGLKKSQLDYVSHLRHAGHHQLSIEVDKCFKKVFDGIEVFETLWIKRRNLKKSGLTHSAVTFENQLEKYEFDIKREVKKLQKLRDQLKSWIDKTNLKDLSGLHESRSVIERSMEKFRKFERERKIKPFSDVALEASSKVHPVTLELAELNSWLSGCIDALNIQIDQLESEIETLYTSERRTEEDKSRLDEKKSIIHKHKYHVKKLETLLRILHNIPDDMDVTSDKCLRREEFVNQLKRIKDDIEYYIESNHDVDFKENEFLYDDIEAIQLFEQHLALENSSICDISCESGDPREPIVGSPHTSISGSYHSPRNTLASSPYSSRRSCSSGSEVGSPRISKKCCNKSDSFVDAMDFEDEDPCHSSSPSNAEYTPTDCEELANGGACCQQVLEEVAALKASRKSLSPLRPPGADKISEPKFLSPERKNICAAIFPTDNTNNTDSMQKMAEEKDDHHNIPSLQLLTAQLLEKATEKERRPPSPKLTYNLEIPPILSTTPLGPQPLDKDQQKMFERIEAAHKMCPITLLPRAPFRTPSYYPQVSLRFPSNIVRTFTNSTLFWIFYYSDDSNYRMHAAKTLKQHQWRFHTKHVTWFQRIHDKSQYVLTADYEEGSYLYFDYGKWCERRMDGFRFEYEYLEHVNF